MISTNLYSPARAGKCGKLICDNKNKDLLVCDRKFPSKQKNEENHHENMKKSQDIFQRHYRYNKF
jgi:hypothetical protein